MPQTEPATSAYPPQACRTAAITSLMRMLHTRYDRPALIHDDWADRLISPAEKRAFAAAALDLDPAAQADQSAQAHL